MGGIVDVWRSQSNPGKQTLLSLGCAAVGLALAIGFRDFGGSDRNAMAGFLLGLLLLVVGLAGFLASGTQTVVVDPAARLITVEDAGRFRTKRRVIPFNDILGVSIGYLGKRSNHVTWYYLVLKLRSGENYPLFAPGRLYEGGSSRPTVESWKGRIERYLGS